MKMDSFVWFIYYCSPCGGHGVFDYSVLGVGMGVWGGRGGGSAARIDSSDNFLKRAEISADANNPWSGLKVRRRWRSAGAEAEARGGAHRAEPRRGLSLSSLIAHLGKGKRSLGLSYTALWSIWAL